MVPSDEDVEAAEVLLGLIELPVWLRLLYDDGEVEELESSVDGVVVVPENIVDAMVEVVKLEVEKDGVALGEVLV